MHVDHGRGAVTARRLAEGAALREVVDTGAADAWIELDAGARWDDWYEQPYGWTTWEQSDGGRALSAAVRSGEALTEAQLALALCHRDGRIREAVLAGVAHHPALLPLLVLRCADWAEPVRVSARRRLAESLDAGRAVGLLPLILRVDRRQHGEFATELAEGLLRGAPGELLAPLYTTTNRLTRRYAYRRAAREGLLSPAELARVAARDADPVVQSLCADAALAAVRESGAYDDVLGPLLAARGPRVRSIGVTALRPAERPEEAMGFLADPSGLVRACARYVVRQGGIDPLAWYRDRCADPGDPTLRPSAVVGLAECGARADAALLWPLLKHPVAAVRAQAVAGLRVLDAADVRRLWPMLDDPAAGVVREVTLAVLPSAWLVPEEWLLERLGGGRATHVRRAAFRLALECGDDVRRRALDAARDDPDERLGERAARITALSVRR
ncbi:hypothetical protein NFX46_31780 [Streptomyces phaeoluteigriseus]|uniref:PBS lyase n=1 Tax=Streptomyces phaeoluteigriseus TaxID=114686 RepID=A0ABY4ZG29_9ACTN|nr:hypothetical protein [Streptomyces phaeoluteigriseus]USQ87911.1 hypothetical protein NFX46_31780 [Streptomyces phaeoluteigriseus]